MIVELGIGYLLFKKLKGNGYQSDEETLPPVAIAPDLPQFRVEMVAHFEPDHIYRLEGLSGMVYKDPMTGEQMGEWTYESWGYIIGNADATGFLSASASVGGTVTFILNGIEYENVLVFSSQEDAEAELEPSTPSPDDPQKQPEDGGSTDTGGSGYLQPDYGLGGGMGSYVGGSW